MQKGINFAAAEFEDKLTQLINTSGLPACVIRLIITKLYDQIIRQEAALVEKEKAEFLANEE